MDIDDLLKEEHLVPSTLMHDARHCGYLDSAKSGGSSSQAAGTLPTQSQHQLPMWLAKSLHQRSHIHIDLPPCYGAAAREGLRSDPSFMNLQEHSEYYFGVGVDLARLLDEELLEQLGIAFNKRLQVLMTTALNAGPRQDLSDVMAKLTLQEKQFLEAGREAKNAFEKWRSRQTKMESSALVGHKRAAPNSRRPAPRQKQHS